MIPVSLLRSAHAVVLIVLLSIVFPSVATQASTTSPLANAVRISQVYGGGGSSYPYRCDYVELFNAGSSDVTMSGWSVQVFNVNLGAFQAALVGNVTIPSGHYALAQAGCVSSGISLPTPDIILNGLYLNTMPTASGEVALVGNGEAIADNMDPDVVDFVGYGAAIEYEGGGSAPGLSTTTAAFRAGGGCTDTDDNRADFTAAAPAPRNSASSAHQCEAAPAVSAVAPPGGAADVALNSDVVVTFSEPVGVAAGWFDITCDLGGPVAATVTGGPTTWTIDPGADFLPDDGCALSVFAAKVTDVDLTDPPDNMAADFTSSFSTRAGQCGDGATPIHAIQGAGSASPLTGKARTVEAVVTGVFSGLGGITLQEDPLEVDANALTSEALFVADPAGLLEGASPGDGVRVTGTVAEQDGMTALTGLTRVLSCGAGTLPSEASVTLPLGSAADWERYEGMRVSFSQDLTVIENAELGLTGSVTLVAGGRPQAFTQSNEPDAAGFAAYEAAIARRTVVLDDGSAALHPDPIAYPSPGLSASNTLRAGDVITSLTGVVGERGDAYRIQPTQAVAVTAANPRPAVVTFGDANIRAAFVSLHNFFTTIPIDPALALGANSNDEYGRQRDKLVSLLKDLDCDVIGLSRLENVGYAALDNLVAALNAATAEGTYARIAPSSYLWGQDATSVGLIYRPAALMPIGGPVGTDAGAFVQVPAAVHRMPMAQTFETVPWGERFTVVVNDWHGRGDCPVAGADSDQGDGQACWNAARTGAARDLAAWLATDPMTSRDPDILVLGELNALAAEGPLDALAEAGYIDTVPSAAYTTVWGGRTGAGDHALVTPGLAEQVAGAAAWAVNADEPSILDYNMEDKTSEQLASLYAPDAYRASDHDPLIVGLTLLPDISTLGGGYGTAWHTGQGEVRLGEEWSDETDGAPDANDGVVRVEGSWNNGEGSVSVTVTAAGGTFTCLDAWLDFGDGLAVEGQVETPDGDWDANEHVVAGLPMPPGVQQPVTFALPRGIIDGDAQYNMRFRLTPAPDPAAAQCPPASAAGIAAGVEPAGRADGGEVEDYTFEAGPLAVMIVLFSAAPAGDGIVVGWETASEVSNLGFNLYRGGSAVGPWTRLNAALIPGQGPGAGEGHAYEWLDGDVEMGHTYFYQLEDVGANGARTLHGPVSAVAGGPTALALGRFDGVGSPGPVVPAAILALLAAGAWVARRRPGS